MNDHIDRILFLIDTLHQTGTDLATTEQKLADKEAQYVRTCEQFVREQKRSHAAEAKVAELEAKLAAFSEAIK